MWLFYLIIFLIPSNLAKHFPLASSYVGGNLVDYLIPSLYLTDILITLLLIIKPIKSLPKPIIIFLLCLIPSVIFSASPIPAIYKWLKFLEIGLLIAWIKQYKHTLSYVIIAKSVIAAVIFQSTLAIGQFIHQGSLFGYWFLGEQPYTAATPGIDKIIWFDGSLKIPPLGTTPHPNVLAGFLVISLVLVLKGLTLKGRSLFTDKVRPFAILVIFIPLFLTFSLSAWLTFLLIGLPFILQGQNLKARKFLMIYYGSLLIILSLFGEKFSYLAPESSFSRRSQLSQMAISMFKDKPLTGIGLNNFTVAMDNYGLVPATTRFLQPVHNIYLLILSETGLIGFLGFLYLLWSGRTLLRSDKVRPFAILLFLGLFDHWPLTLQTGLLIFSTMSLLDNDLALENSLLDPKAQNKQTYTR